MPIQLINGKPWFDLDPYIDSQWFLDNFKQFCLAIGKSHAYILPGTHGNASLYSKKYPDLATTLLNISKTKDPEILELIEGLNPKQLRTFCLYYFDTYPMNYSLILKGFKDTTVKFAEKHMEEKTVFFPPATHFTFFFDWLAKQNIFTHIGRTGIFLSEAKDPVQNELSNHLHRDYPDGRSRKDQFIWVNFNPGKKFYLTDPKTGERSYITSTASVFENVNWHGVEDPPHACFSLRVDGVFTEEFLEKTGLKEHFTK